MKKTYVNPELDIVALAEMDIVTTSDKDKDQALWQPGESEKNWDDILNGYVRRN